MAHTGEPGRPNITKAKRNKAEEDPASPYDMRKRRITDADIRGSETRYRRLFESAQDGILIIDAETGLITDANPYLESMLGYSRKELSGKKPWETNAFKNMIPNNRKLSEIGNTGYLRFKELPLQTRKGKPIETECSSNSYLVSGKKVIQFNFRNITKQKHLYENMRLAEERYSGVFNNAWNCVVVYKAEDNGKDFIIVDINRAAEMTEKVIKGDVLGKRVTSVFPGVKDFGILDVFRKVWKSGKPEHFPAKVYKDERIAGWRDNYIYRLDSGEVVAIYQDLTREKQAEESLRMAHDQLVMSQKAAGSGVWVWDFNSGKLEWSDELFRLFGIDPKQGSADFDTWRRILHPEDRQTAEDLINKAILNHTKLRSEYRIVLPSGEVRWIISIGNTEYSPLGAPLRMSGICLDISDRKAVEAAVQKSNRIIYLIKECNQVLVYATDEHRLLERICSLLVDRGGYILAWVGYAMDDNSKSIKPVAQKGFDSGYLEALKLTWDARGSRGELVGKAIVSGEPCISRDIISDEKTSLENNEALERGYRSSISVPLKTEKKTIGAINIYSASPDAFNEQEVELLIELANDLAYGIMSLRNRDALAGSEARFRSIVETSHDLIMLTRPDGKIEYMSPACKKVLGWPPEHFLGKRISVTHPEDRALTQTALSKAVYGGRGSDLQYRIITRDGRTRWVSHSWSPIMLDGRLQLIASVVQDITEQKATQDKLTDIIQSLPDATFAIDLNGRIIYWNKAMEALSGISSEKMLGKPSREVGRHFYGRDRLVAAELLLKPSKKIEMEYSSLERTGDTLTAKGWVPRLLQGKLGYVWVMARPLYGSDRRIIGAIESVRDITEQKRNEDALQSKNRMLFLISECNQAIVRGTDETSLLQEICRILIDTGGYRMAWAGYPEKGGRKRIIPIASSGIENGYLKGLDITWADTARGRGPTGTSVRTGRPSIARDIHNDPRFAPWRSEALKRKYSSSIAIPLIFEGDTCGVLNIYAEAPDAFDSDEVHLLEELAQDLAHGLGALQGKSALAESEKTFAAIFNNTTDIVVFLDSSGKILKINPSIRRMWGYRPADVIGRNFTDLTEILPPVSISQMVENFRMRLSGVDTKPYVVEARTKDGKQVYVEVRGSAVRKEDGIVGAVVTLSDITERMTAEKRLLASYQVASVLSAGGSMSDTWPVILQTICTNLGWEWGEIWLADREKKFLSQYDAWHAPDKKYLQFERISSKIQFRPGSGLPGRVWVRGKPIWVKKITKAQVVKRASAAKSAGLKSACAFPLMIKDDVVGVMVFFSEKERSQEKELLQSLNLLGYQIGQFMKRKSAEDMLRVSETRFRNVFAHGPVGIMLADHDFRFISANPSACKIFGYSETEMYSLTFMDLAFPEFAKHERDKMELLGKGRMPFFRTEKQYKRKDGTIIWGLVNASAIRDADGRLLYYLAMIEDITEQKRNVEVLRSQKEQLEELSKIKEVFMADMAHELKTPLSVILLNLEMIRNMDPKIQGESIAESHDLIWRNTNRMTQTIEQIMKLSSIDSVDIARKKFSLRSVIWQVVSDYLPLAKTKGLRLDMEGKDVFIVGDQHLISMAISNLISNSIKFTDRGYVHVSWEDRGGIVTIKVTDSGIGIKKENQGKVFEKFFKENHDAPGSGIGLAISYMVVSKMGGRIEFNSIKGKGSTFRITIPQVSKL